MLNKFKEWYRKNINDKQANRIDEALDFKNRIVEICGMKYFLGKGSMTDLPDLIKVDRAAYGKKVKWSPKRFQAGLKNRDNRFYLILRHEDELVGFICIMISRQQTCCHIENLAILPQFQKRGLGYFLTTTIIERAREMGLHCVIFTCRKSNEKSQSLVQDLGFVKVDEKPDYFDDGEAAVDYRLHLDKRNYLAANNFGR
ncbi:GNAT family N-acetyltransferase [Fructilactobacillus myrtifloralis]|uniref:GNAT family N-acetyltransferase n=1 Tax=Fructilactobacillus myrtifloralis TaxID=2940301 RepID=A0ABY5BRC1_9LACO|nr:GNAT family N-acetyltransferase [Fructilactobacillus myrtifloralis]USS84939.1 GNAT family N-acetyltransferase [Fructilactobacillus myrtifloralis]